MATLKQSTTRNRVFKMISSTDHFSLKTSASPVVNLSKNAAAFGAAAGAVSEIANGWYSVALTTADTGTLGDLAFYITGTGADDTDFCDQVVANILGDTLPVNVTQWNGTNVSAPATAGIPDVNVKNYNNQAAVTDAGNLPKVDVEDWKGGVVPAVTVTGVPKVDVADWLGTAVTAATAGIPDTNVKNINNVAAATPGASGGILISGSNAGTTTLGALTVTGATTCTGNVSMAAGLTITQSSANTSAVAITGNGTGHGILATSGSGATGDGIKAISAATNGNGLTLVHTGTGADLNATTTPLVLAKTTNITGFNDIAATAIVSAGAITTSGGAVSTVTTVTNQLTAAQVATGVWQDAVAGDFTTASSIGKSLYTSGVVPGGTNGLFIAGTNAATTVTTALTTTFTGNLTGSVASVTGAVGSVTGNVGGNVVGSVGSVTSGGLAQADLDKVFSSSGATLAELAQATPPTNPRPDQALMLLYEGLRNASTTTATTYTISNDAGTVTSKATLSDDGVTFTRAKMQAGP